jgi:uncharacterized membrane protein
MWALLILVVLAVPALGIAGFFIALAARDRLLRTEGRLTAIEGRLAALSATIDQQVRATPSAAPSEPQPDVARGPVLAPAPQPSAQPAVASEAAPEPEPAAARAHEATDDAVAPSAVGAQADAPEPPHERAGQKTSDRGLADLERLFGGTWAVWIGGLALALSGIFLVRLSIEQGLLGPGVRVGLGALLAIALVAAGEWTRRNERRAGVGGIAAADIPSILTAAGTVVAYATVYAAYGLYQFLDPGPAFILLGVVALATLAAALLHGPALAGLGIVGAAVTPLLVSTEAPNYWALYMYLAVVSAAAFSLARIRMWRWLTLTALVAGLLWTLPALESTQALPPHLFHACTGFVLVALLIVAGLFFGPPSEPDQIDQISSAALVCYLFAAFLLVVTNNHDAPALIVFSILVFATVAIAWRSPAATGALACAALMAVLVLGQWAVEFYRDPLVVQEPSARLGVHLALGAAYAALFGCAGFLAQGRSARPIIPVLWCATGVLTPIAVLIALYYSLYGFERSSPFAGLALLLAAFDAIAAESLINKPPRPGVATAAALFATGGVASLALALTLALEKGWLTAGLSLMVPGIVWVFNRRPLPLLRLVAATMVGIVIARTAWNPRIMNGDLGSVPILNWLLYGYGVPAASFFIAGHLLRQRADDLAARTTEAGAIFFTVLLVVFEIRHLLYGADLFHPRSGLAEVALDVCIGLALTIGLERMRQQTRSVVHEWGAWVVGGLSFAGILLGLGHFQNPMLTGESVGGAFFNLILLGYGLPAILLAVLALGVAQKLADGWRWLVAITAVALALAYLSLEVRTFYHGPVLTQGAVTPSEQYTYSVVWLAFGLALLAPGILLSSQKLRLASAGVMLATVAKAFLYDLSNLEGAYRAFSLLGLGLVLMAVGWLYQRLLSRPRPPAPPSAAGAQPG